MYLYDSLKPKIGLISITDIPRSISMVGKRENFISRKHRELKKFLKDKEIEVIDFSDYSSNDKSRIGIYSSEDYINN